MKEIPSSIAQMCYELSAEGFRMTELRKAVLAIFAEQVKPFSADEISSLLEKDSLRVHKTTLYRELDVLIEAHVLSPIYFHDQIQRYEYVQHRHHHHLVCTKCNIVKDIHLDCDFERQESTIAQKTHFSSLRHSLEFFGLCKKCSSVSR